MTVAHDPNAGTAREPLVVSDVLKAAAGIVRVRPVLLIGSAVICAIPGALFSRGAFYTLASFVGTRWFEGNMTTGFGRAAVEGLRVVCILVLCAAAGFVLGLGTLATQHAHGGVSSTSDAALFAASARRVPALTATVGLLVFAMVFLVGGGHAVSGSMCLAWLAPVFPALFALAPAVCASESVGPLRAIHRSVMLTKGNRLRVGGLVLHVAMPKLALLLFVTAAFDDVSAVPWFAGLVAEALTSAATYLAAGVVFGEVYVRLAGLHAPKPTDLAAVFA